MTTNLLLYTFVPLALAFAGVAWFLRGMGTNRKLLSTGIPGVGTILAMADTNVMVNDRPVLKLALRVELAGQAPYDAEAKVVAPFAALGVLRPGARVAVRVDPTDPQVLAVDLSQIAVTPSSAAG